MLSFKPAKGEIKNIQRGSRELSANIMISNEMAEKVAKGELCPEKAVEIYRKRKIRNIEIILYISINTLITGGFMVSKLTELAGKDVFTEEGERVGALKDITIDPLTGKVLAILIADVGKEFFKKLSLEDVRGLSIPFKGVRAISDVVILKNTIYNSRPVE